MVGSYNNLADNLPRVESHVDAWELVEHSDVKFHLNVYQFPSAALNDVAQSFVGWCTHGQDEGSVDRRLLDQVEIDFADSSPVFEELMVLWRFRTVLVGYTDRDNVLRPNFPGETDFDLL